MVARTIAAEECNRKQILVFEPLSEIGNMQQQTNQGVAKKMLAVEANNRRYKTQPIERDTEKQL
ncbi:unnamed protein product, partial [Dovyalis caffra]